MNRIQKIHIASIVLILAFMILACAGCADYSFRKTLDKYEALADKYADFVKKYGKNPEYGSYPEYEFMELMNEWAEVTADVEKIDMDELSGDDLLYFTQVITRVSRKMEEIESGSADTSIQGFEMISDGFDEQSVDTWQYYSNPEEGISFSFPCGWSLGDSSNYTKYLFEDGVIAPEEEGFNANVSVIRTDYDEEAEFMMSCTKDELQLLYSQMGYENLEMYYLVDGMIDGMPARAQCFAFDFADTESSFSGRFVDVIYTYVHNNNFYVIRCATLENLYDKYGPIFDGIMETYTIS